jgi:quinol monooxygenase YgiN
MAVLVLGTLRFPPAAMDKVRAPLKKLVAATREHDGCIAYDTAEDLFDPGLIRFSELWPDAAILERHLQAPHIPAWRAVARELGLQSREFKAYEADKSWDV